MRFIASISFSHDVWTQICKNIFSFINSNLKLIQYKILHRVHITQYRKHKMGFSNSPICAQCNLGSLDTYLYSCYCTPVQNFWSGVIDKLYTTLAIEIPLFPSVCLLGLFLETDVAPHYVKLVYVALILAKKAILHHWKTKQPLNINHWLHFILEHKAIERMAAGARKSTRSYSEMWSPFIRFFGVEQ